MEPNIKALLDLLAAHPGARGGVAFVLFCMMISPRATAFMLLLVVATHSIWINP